MKITITAVDKMMIVSLLPQAESILVQTIARDISRKIELSQKDRDTIKLRPTPEGPGMTWNVKDVKKTETEVEFSTAEIEMLRGEIDKLDKAKKVTTAMLDTCLKIRDIKTKSK